MSRREAREAALRAAAAKDPGAAPDPVEPGTGESTPVRTTPASDRPAPSPSAPTPAEPTPSAPTPAAPAPAPAEPTPAAPAPAEPTPAAPAPSLPAPRAAEQPSPVRATAGQPSDPVPAASASEVRAPAYARASAASTSVLDDDPPTRAPRSTSPGLEDLFSGESTTDDIGTHPRPRDKRRRRVAGWVALGVIVAILGGLSAGGWYVWSTYEDRIRAFMGWEEPKDYEAGLANGEALLTIVSGDTGYSISPKLHEAGITKTPEAFYDYLIAEGLNPPFQPGVFQMQQQMTSAAALEAILDPANKLENMAQLREGLTVEQSLPILADVIGIPLEEFQAAVATPADYGVSASSLEGWLFPATYQFDPGVTATDVISTLVGRTVQALDGAGVPVDDRQRVLTVASIIQREARFEDDMQKVATVIDNRMDPNNQETFGYLQMDSTAQFGYGEMHSGSASSSAEALADDNPWNTYTRQGLPAGPISNPGDAAINAVMNPAPGDWLYFVTVNLDTGETVFTSNLNDHNRAVEQWISWCRDNPDSGC
ncbi:endolytic transglycosylase MltG [Microbacterium sp. NPDC055357]